MMYREGSKLAVVYAAFVSGGIDAAVAKANELGLAPSTLKIQIKRKNWGGDQPVSAPSLKTPPRVTASPMSANGRQRYRFAKGKREFVIVHEGPQQSIIKWLDTRDEQCVPNGWMVPIK